MRTIASVVSAVLLLGLFVTAPLGGAIHDESECEIAREETITVAAPGDGDEDTELFHVQVNEDDPGTGVAYVYQESNGFEGLQTGGQSELRGQPSSANCGHSADTLIL